MFACKFRQQFSEGDKSETLTDEVFVPTDDQFRIPPSNDGIDYSNSETITTQLMSKSRGGNRKSLHGTN